MTPIGNRNRDLPACNSVSQPTTAYPTQIQCTTEAFTSQLTTTKASVNRIPWFPSPAATNGEFIFIT